MINKLTIEREWMKNPEKTYFAIQNPIIDKTRKKVDGLQIKIVEFKVENFLFTIDFINFVKIDEQKNKRFPSKLVFDKRQPDAEREVYTSLTPKNNISKNDLRTFAIFHDEKIARFHKIVRLHRLSENLLLTYNHLKDKNQDVDSKTKLNIDVIKKCFNDIQDTGYFEELERIQTDFPDLSVL